MADENYTLPEVPVYREAIRKILNEDPVNAEEVLNPLVQALLENVHFVKLLAQAKAESDALDEHVGDDTSHLTAAERSAWNGKAEGNHSHTAADVGAVPTSRKVNGKALSADISLSAADVSARPSTWTPSATDVGAIPASQKGAANGVSTLDASSLLSSSQIPVIPTSKGGVPSGGTADYVLAKKTSNDYDAAWTLKPGKSVAGKSFRMFSANAAATARTGAEVFNSYNYVYRTNRPGSGNAAIGSNSIATGTNTSAEGSSSFAMGQATVAGASCQLVLGMGNVINTSSLSRLIIGSGSNTTYSNCFRATTTGVYAAGSYSASGADYAELFEWEDKNPEALDRVGLFVTLSGSKIRLAGPNDDFILGIVSGNPSVLGDVYDDQWQGMYLYDIFGRPLWEDVEEPDYVEERPDPEHPGQTIKEVAIPAHREIRQKLNPEYDDSQPYIPRSKRAEWDAVGLLGKLVAVDDGSCVPDGWCTVGEGGIAIYSASRTRYRMMERLDTSHIRILIL